MCGYFCIGFIDLTLKGTNLLDYTNLVVYNLEVSAYFTNSGILSPKNQTRKIVKIHEDFELYKVFLYNVLCQTVLIFPIYMLFTKIIKTFWSRDVTSIQGFSTF